MNTDQDVIRLWKSLLPQITQAGNAIEIRIKGNVVKLPIQRSASAVVGRQSKEFR